ncbi:MAG TPA: methyltransferase domain-containing protein [Pseudonocardiaceae bacterium]
MPQSYYDGEATRYDDTRGGEPRANAAADAILRLLPPSARLVLDVAGGTGIVGARLDRRVISLDSSPGMAAIAATRLPGRVVLGDATRLPLATGSVDAVTAIWLLHLLDEQSSADVLTAAARVLRPGGTLITTTDKSDAYYTADDDVAEILGPAWRATRPAATDGLDRITELAASHGLAPIGRTTFTGLGQGRAPVTWCAQLSDPLSGWLNRCGPDRIAWLCQRLAALPDQHRPRADPEYRLVAFG